MHVFASQSIEHAPLCTQKCLGNCICCNLAFGVNDKLLHGLGPRSIECVRSYIAILGEGGGDVGIRNPSANTRHSFVRNVQLNSVGATGPCPSTDQSLQATHKVLNVSASEQSPV